MWLNYKNEESVATNIGPHIVITEGRKLTKSFDETIASPNLFILHTIYFDPTRMSVSHTTLRSRLLFLSYIALITLELLSGDLFH